jgi:hypothetical protein
MNALKLFTCTALLVSSLGSAGTAKTIWQEISETAPLQTVFEDLRATAPLRTVFDDLRDTSPVRAEAPSPKVDKP